MSQTNSKKTTRSAAKFCQHCGSAFNFRAKLVSNAPLRCSDCYTIIEPVERASPSTPEPQTVCEPLTLSPESPNEGAKLSDGEKGTPR